MAYRGEIDGLRAIAVFSVILCHVGAPLSGGFVGVDVFFVISGFVITRLLVREIEEGEFSFAGFYERRVRRIAPALLLLIPLTALASLFIMLPPDLDEFGESAIAAALMVSNFHFWLDAGYFEAAAMTKPLLHTWSLGIEEQFYLIFPLAFVFLWRRSKRAALVMIVLVAALSFAASVWATRDLPSGAFYLAPFRLWELLLGAIIAIAPVRRLYGSVWAAAGLAMIATSCLVFSDATTFPGAAALLPTVGAALVINGAQPGGLAARLLGVGPLAFLGKISYSLYLVHWPLIALVQYRQNAPLDGMQALTIIAVSIGLATLSWRFVEQPFRKRGRSGVYWRVLGGATAAVGVSCSIGMAIDVTEGFAGHLPAKVQAAFAAREDVWPDSERCLLNSKGRTGPQPDDIRNGRICAFGPGQAGLTPEGRQDYLIWGDSHAVALAPAIIDAADAKGARGFFTGAGSCPPLLDYKLKLTHDVVEARCRQVNAAAMEKVKQLRPTYVFMVARWPKYTLGSEYGEEGREFTPASVKPPVAGEDLRMKAALDATLAQLRGLGVTPVLVMDVPEVGYDIPYVTARNLLDGDPKDLAPPRAAVEARQSRAREILQEAALKHGGVMIDPTSAFCDGQACRVERDGVGLYHDADHLSLTGAKSLSPFFVDLFKGAAEARAK